MANDQQLWGFFQNVDKDRSGRISAQELGQALSNGSWEPFNPATISLMINMFDPQKTNQIDFNAFKGLWKYVTDWQGTFRQFDRDGSGAIDFNEMRTALQTFGYRLSDQFLQAVFAKYDRQRRNKVLFDDFVHVCLFLQIMTQQFSQYDHQRTGTITVQYEQFLSMCLASQV